MAEAAVHQITDVNGQVLVTQSERHALIQKLSATWNADLSTRIEGLAFEKSRGVKVHYSKILQNYYQQIQQARQSRSNGQQMLNNTNGSFVNQQPLNTSQQPTLQMHSQPQLSQMLNQTPRFPTPQPQPQHQQPPQQSTTRMSNSQPGVPNQLVRLRETPKFNQTPMNTGSYTSSTPSMDLSPNYPPQQPPNMNQTLNDYLSQPPMLQNRYSNQPSMTARPRLPTNNLSGNFSSQSSSTNSNDILHHMVLNNSSNNPMASSSSATPSVINPSSNSDRLLQQILTSNNDMASNKMSLINRQVPVPAPAPSQPPPMMPQQNRSINTTNTNHPNSINSLRASLLLTQQPSPSPVVGVMPTSNIQVQPSPNVTIQHSPLSNSNSSTNLNSFPTNTQGPSSLTMNNSTPLSNNYSSPITRSVPVTGSGSISSPDEDTINLIKYLKENIGKLQSIGQRFTNEGNHEKARNAQAIHQQMIQFINNPTYESLPNAKHIRDMLERATIRNQSAPIVPPNVPTTNVPIQQVNNMAQFEKAMIDYISRDQKRRLILSRIFVEPLSDVVNGVPHKKIRLDNDSTISNRISQQPNSVNHSSLLAHLNDELNLLPANVFSVERLSVAHQNQHIDTDDEYSSRKGLVLRCKLLEAVNPLIPPLRLRISPRYPHEQPEVLSLTDKLPPKLEFTDGHPYFEQISTLFISYLFKLPPQHTITDILNIWRQSVQAAL
ncbi:hypothetical protein I4U23_006300 [Adineta vaga]|nr:hypothetical protein I4U23_006300 [Adineta vaga]